MNHISHRLIVISNSYPTKQNPTRLVFIHNRVLAFGKYFDDVIVISRKKRSFWKLLFKPFKLFNLLINWHETEVHEGVFIHYINQISFFPENILPLNGLLYILHVKAILNKYICNNLTVQIATWGDFSFVSSICLNSLRIPYFTSAIGNYENTYLKKGLNINTLVLNYIYNKACFVMCLSQELKSKIISTFPGVKTILFISGVDLTKFKYDDNMNQLRAVNNFKQNELIIIYTGRITPKKGIVELIQAIETLVVLYPEISIRLIMAGETEKNVQHMLKRKFISYVGVLNQKELLDYLNLSDIFILPSYSEGTPNSLLEAMAVGLPVIATDVGGIPAVIENNKNGLLIKPMSESQIVEAIKKLIFDSTLRLALSESAKFTIQQSYNSSLNNIELYEKVKSTNCVFFR